MLSYQVGGIHWEKNKEKKNSRIKETASDRKKEEEVLQLDLKMKIDMKL